jgi:hypothetical protein
MAQTTNAKGSKEAGAGQETGLAATTAAILFSSTYTRDREAMHLTVRAAGKGTFNLNYLFSPDDGTTWLIGKQVASGTVTVDGATASYTQSAELDVQVGFNYKVELYNTSGSTLDYAFEVRLSNSG